MFVFLFPDRSALEYLLSVFRPSAVCISPSRLTYRKEELHPILCKEVKAEKKTGAYSQFSEAYPIFLQR